MTDKLFQARVDERTAKRLLAYAEAKTAETKKKMSESKLVEYALDLVVAEADRQLAALQQKVRADAERTAQALQGESASTRPTSALQLGPGVPAGTKTFQTKIKSPKTARLHAIGRAYDASDSDLIRRGFKLIIDETVRNKAQLLQQLHNDYVATCAALVGEDIDTPEPGVAPDPAEQSLNQGTQNDHLVEATAAAGPAATDGAPG